jgi:hypothetical protein
VTEPTPIRDGLIPEADAEREMSDYVLRRVKIHTERVGEPCDTIAIVTMSHKGRIAHSFSFKEPSDRLATCSAAAAMLLSRGTKDD